MSRNSWLLAYPICLLSALTCEATIVTSGSGGLTLVAQGPATGTAPAPVPANLAASGTAFALDQLGSPHFTVNVNNGTYGNSSSWIGGGATGTSGPFIGINLGASTSLTSFAFGRSNVTGGDPCGICTDRNLGDYTLQYRNDGSIADDAGWITIGGMAYTAGGPTAPPALAPGNLQIQPNNYSVDAVTYQRHAYNFTPVSATAVRLIVPATGAGAGTAVDEIELYSTPRGYNITWSGNDGGNFTVNPPATVPANLALASGGATPFADGALQPGGTHDIPKLNDGLYGNSNSWISASGGSTFAGIDLPGSTLYAVSSIAFGRDNGNGDIDDSPSGTDACGGQCDDRYTGTYTLQYTLLNGASASTLATGNAATGWATIGTVTYNGSDDTDLSGLFTGFLRHEFGLSLDSAAIQMRGFRILSSNNDAAIDEIEIYGVAVPEPATWSLLLVSMVTTGAIRSRRRVAE